MKTLLKPVLLAVSLSLVLAGCGGGGGGGTLQPGSGSLGVFVTDSFRDDHDHVWATIHRVELINSTGSAQTVFDSSAGVVVDLKTLRDATGQRFSFLSNVSVTSATHTGVRVTVGSSMTLFPRGAATGQVTPVDDSVPHDGQGRPQIQFSLAAPRNLGSGSDDLVIDFDLANFTIAGGKVKPTLKEGSKTGLEDRSRHENEDYKGTISNLAGTAPNFTFTLTRPNGMSFTVETNSTTTIFNSNSAPSPTLANGKTVEVRGTFNVANDRLTATGIKIEDAGEADEPQIKGAPSAIDATAKTFKVSTGQVEGFVPTQTTVNVVTTTSTVFRSKSGVLLDATQFFTSLATSPSVEVEGTYNAATNTLTARKAKLDDDGAGGEQGQEAEARGGVTAIDATAFTFTLSPVTEWEGFILPPSLAVTVTTTAGTEFKDAANNHVTRAAFFTALTSGAQVKVEGTFSGSTIAARQIRRQ